MPADLSGHAKTLVEQYRLDDGIFNLKVRPASAYTGAPPSAVDLAGYPGVELVAIQAAEETPRRAALAAGDLLIVRGSAQVAGVLAVDKGLAFRADAPAADLADALFNRTSGLAEVVIRPRSRHDRPDGVSPG